MPYERGFGMGGCFRGSHAAWPYIGRGRGGLPRCGYLLSGQLHPPAGQAPVMHDNLETLQNEAASLKDRLARIETLINRE